MIKYIGYSICKVLKNYQQNKLNANPVR